MSTIRDHAPNIHNPVRELAREHPGLVKIGRAGWFTKGVVYVLAGILALQIAAKASGFAKGAQTGQQEASPTGAIKTVAGSGGGTFLLWLLAIGMLLYAVWRVVSAFLPGGKDAKAWATRIGYIASAVVYVTFAFSAIALARDSNKVPNGNQKVTDISAKVMSHTGGRLLFGAIGVIIIATGLYRIYKGLKMDVDDELDMSGTGPGYRKVVAPLGAIGEIGRGIGFAVVGFFLTRAAIQYDTNDATGLDGALRRIAAHSWGVVVVIIVGIGFAAYGAFCLATFSHRRLEAP
ncbi:MAG TPA: DUF1206 domain-containing protein [Ilumatobacteraceae bacterium]